MSLLAQREPLDQALQNPQISEDEKRKIKLAIEVRQFASEELGLNVNKIYTSYVKLDRPHVTWVVSAAPQWELQSYLWSFPIVGTMPYKGFFSEKEALEEEQNLSKKNLDTYVRGVNAYSTLGWFKDPLLSSMMTYSDHDLVDTIIHELVHATLYIKNHADFNERFAVFLGQKGMELFYQKKEGHNSETLKKALNEIQDDKLFSLFITDELNSLEDWYKQIKNSDRTEVLRQKRIHEIQERFETQIIPQLKTKQWLRFKDMKLNNARLTLYKTYMKNLDDFENLYAKTGSNFKNFLDLCRLLENHSNPEQGLKDLTNK